MFTFKINAIIGHRGCDEGKFDNTIAAFLKAVELGAEMVEFDIRKTKDGVLMVHHDAEIFNYRIKAYDFDFLKRHAANQGLEIATLEEVLKALEGKIKLVAEIKERGFEERAINLLLQYFSPKEFVAMSFLDEVVLRIRKEFPTVTTGLLLGVGNHGELGDFSKIGLIRHRLTEIFPWKRVAACKAQFIAPNWQLLAFGMLGKAHKIGLPVFTWTVDDERRLVYLMKKKMLSGVITDKPGFALKVRKTVS